MISVMKDMLHSGVHFGHEKRFWNPKMKSFIFGVNHGIHIIDLEKTLPLFERAINVLRKVAARNGKVLFVGTKRQAQKILINASISCSMPYVSHRWLGGTLTNYKTIRKSVKKLRNLETMKKEGMFDRLTKKEALQNDRKIEKLSRLLGGIKDMGGLPDIVVVIDAKKEGIAIKEAKCLGIPVIAIVDTNSSPDGVEYVIPGNDDSMKAISFYMNAFSSAVAESMTPSKS